MTVLENIMFPLRFKKVERAEAERRAREIAALVRIDGVPRPAAEPAFRRPAAARRARPRAGQAAAPAAARRAAVESRRRACGLTMRTEIRRIQRELGVTTILVTHDQIEATTMADRVVVHERGRVEQEGTAEDLYERPDTLFVASFIGSPPINLFDGMPRQRAQRARGDVSRWRNRHTGPSCSGYPAGEPAGGGDGYAGASPPPSRWDAKCSTPPTAPLGVIRFLEAGAERAPSRGRQLALSVSRPRARLLFDKASGRRLDARVAA